MTSAAEAARYLDRHLRALPGVAVEERAGTVRYLRDGRAFAVVRALSRRVDIGFNKIGKARSKRILHARTGRLPFVAYRVVVEAPGDVDAELLAWLRESHDLAGEA